MNFFTHVYMKWWQYSFINESNTISNRLKIKSNKKKRWIVTVMQELRVKGRKEGR
jgi:hypothetical protein